MWTLQSPEIQRNLGYYGSDEQQALLDSTVAIAGVGGEGYEFGLTLARNGVQSFKIADPEVFEPQNINRVPGARISTLGHNKAEVFARDVADINPDAQVTVYSDGITADNVTDFLQGADLAFDGIELRNPEYSVALYREAREQQIHTMMAMNIGFAAIVTTFDHASKYTFEKLMRLSTDAQLSEIAKSKVPISSSVPHLPPYGDMTTLRAVKEGAPLPSIGQGVHLSSALASTQAFLHLTAKVANHRPSPVWAPNFIVSDAMTNSSSSIRFPKIHHYRGIAAIIARTTLGQQPAAGYGSYLK